MSKNIKTKMRKTRLLPTFCMGAKFVFLSKVRAQMKDSGGSVLSVGQKKGNGKKKK